MTEQDWITKLTAEGYVDVQSCENGPDTKFPEHTHVEHTVHAIVRGEFILVDAAGEKRLHEGDRFEIPAGTTHEAKCGAVGCTFVVGIKP